jgi:AcrR family transcriptional regulator
MPKSSVATPPPALNRQRVLQAALDLADESGIEALSMRKLAQTLGVKAMSLYNHVANKDDIIDGIVDHVMGEIKVPRLDLEWKLAMQQRATSAHQVLLRHPWATLPIVSRVNVGPASLRYIDTTLGCLVQAGFSLEMADHAWNAMDNHIYGFTLQELNFPFDPSEYVAAATAGLPLLPADKYPIMNQLTHRIIARQYDGLHDFDFGLNLILNGLEAFRKRA